MVNSKDIPKYLKENAKFCNWKYETRDGRLTKVPYNPHTNNKASVNNANTFTDFNSVVNGLDIYDGIGIRVDGKIIAIEKALLYMIQQVTAFARDYEDEFVELVAKNKNKELERRICESKKELEQSMSRVSKIDLLIQRLYEDNVEGKISDKQFKKMTFAYENEQKTLNVRITELNKIIKNEQEKITNTSSFLNLVKCYTNITKLDAEIIRTFIEKVYIYNADTIGTKKIKKNKNSI